ncbi:hypothetical protein AB0I55_28205 [Actinocatenispora sera]|uniref:Uncharacterized protein n=1 Tax=Actinocatenispora sera TaxID=390989 RepID=A0A810KW13_9ACTN|nr:hypothetical protein [Actinocatenispora sera]BCJ26278.1 hypothetical protein Asera_03860 [Actinocatenispora sera]
MPRRPRLRLLTGLAALFVAVLIGAAAMWYGLTSVVDPTVQEPPVPPGSGSGR